LLVGTGADAVGRLAVGTTANQQLVVDSSTASGLKWVNPSGMVLLKTDSFSAVSSVSLPDASFSSTYSNYKIIFLINTVGGTNSASLRLRVSAADNSTSNYDTQKVVGYGANATGSTTNDGTSFGISSSAADTSHLFTFDIINPFASSFTFVQGVSYHTNSTGSDMQTSSFAGRFSLTTSFDAVSFIASASTITGSYWLYGYNK
jgi:hypothetical protein